MKSFVLFIVFGICIVCSTNSFGQNVVNAPMGAPAPTMIGDIGGGVRESWVHEIRPLSQYELAPRYDASQYPATAGWFQNGFGCWQRSCTPQYQGQYPQYTPYNNYNYCVPQYQNNGFYPQRSVGAQIYCR